MYVVSRIFLAKKKKARRIIVNYNLDMIRHAQFIRKQTGPPVVNNNFRLPDYLT